MFGISYRNANPTDYVLHFSRGKLTREGAGLSFFYFGPVSSIVSVPLASANIPFVFNEPTADFQTLTVQGVGFGAQAPQVWCESYLMTVISAMVTCSPVARS